MKTLKKIEEVVSNMGELIERAKQILSGAPYFTIVWEDGCARLSIDDDKATMTWPEASSGYYDSCLIEEQHNSFPADLLLMTQPEIEVWKAKQKEIYDANEKARRECLLQQSAENQRVQEINQLAFLKRKYGQ